MRSAACLAQLRGLGGQPAPLRLSGSRGLARLLQARAQPGRLGRPRCALLLGACELRMQRLALLRGQRLRGCQLRCRLLLCLDKQRRISAPSITAWSQLRMLPLDALISLCMQLHEHWLLS